MKNTLWFCCAIAILFTSCMAADTNLQWALENKGQNINDSKGFKGIDIDYVRKDLSGKALIAIIDSGFVDTPYLKDSIFINENEVKDDGVDNDGNGFVDDWCGWDFSLGKCIDYDSILNPHGTEIAHIIASSSDEYIGISKSAQLLNIKIDEEDISPETLICAINYAETMNVDIVNMSLSIECDDDLLYSTMKNSRMLFVCAAGNDHRDDCALPAKYELDNVISVGGITNKGLISAYSNFGDNVEIAAPGEDILVLGVNMESKLSSGSSYATAFVSGIACDLIATAPKEFSAQRIKQILLESANMEIALVGYIQNARIVSMKRALEMIS